MGWLSGMLTGYMGRHHEYEAQAREDAEKRAKYEESIYKTLLSHDDPEIQRMAATGILELGQPRKRKGGLQGFIGDVTTSPTYARLKRYYDTPQFQQFPQTPGIPSVSTEESYKIPDVPGDSNVPSPGGTLPEAPAAQGSAALPAESPTQGGAVTPVQPAPQAPPKPPAQLGLMDDQGPEPEIAAPPPPPPGVGAPAPSAMVGNLGVPTNQVAPPTGTWAYPRMPGADEAKLQSELRAWESMYDRIAPGDPENKQKAADAVLARYGHTGANPYQLVRGEYTDATGQVVQAYGVFDKGRGGYLVNGRTEATFRPIDATSFGSTMNQAAALAGYNDANDVPTWDAARVQAINQQLQFQQRQSGAEGTMAGRAAGTLDPKTAAEFHMPQGTQGRQLTGQLVPTPEQRQRRVSIENLRTQIEAIRPMVKATLPSDQELAGLAPNVANAVRQRISGERRNQYAQLTASIDNIINVLARSVGEQKGAQTEADATRAYNTIVQLKGSLADPLGGDTAESAEARIAATLASLDRILVMLPPPPMPTALPAGAPQVATPPPSPAVAQPGGVTLDTPLPPALGSRIDPVTGEFIR